jgi:hypothetical protein
MYFLDVDKLRTALLETGIPTLDYVFMCFLMGNDFMPHLAALNLRTDGLHRLMKEYRGLVTMASRESKSGKEGMGSGFKLVKANGDIDWICMRKLLEPFAKEERGVIIREIAGRRRYPLPKWSGTAPGVVVSGAGDAGGRGRGGAMTKEEVVEYVNAAPLWMSVPLMDYLCPEMELGWRERYRRVYSDQMSGGAMRYLKQMAETWKYYYGKLGLTGLQWYVDGPPLIGDMVKLLGQIGDFEKMGMEPLKRFYFYGHSSSGCTSVDGDMGSEDVYTEYLEYVMGKSVEMDFSFGFERFLWETHVH